MIRKKEVSLFCIATLLLLFICVGLMSCGPEEETPPAFEEAVRYSAETNPYRDVAWNEIGSAANWEKKAKNSGEIYYRFEGSYLEPYEGMNRIYMTLNCYNDGGLHAMFGRDNYYGYWTNIGNRRKKPISFYLICYSEYDAKQGSYVDREYDIKRYVDEGRVDCENEIDHDYYEYYANVPVVMWGSEIRSCLIFGVHYSEVTGMTLHGGQTECVVGDLLKTETLEITVHYANGKSNKLDPEWYEVIEKQPNYPVAFDGFDSSEKGETTVTVSYKNTDVAQTYKCKVMGIKGITVDLAECKTEYRLGDKFYWHNLTVKAIRDDGYVFSVDPRRYKVYGFDGDTAGEQTLTVKYDDTDEFTAEYKICVYGNESPDIHV